MAKLNLNKGERKKVSDIEESVNELTEDFLKLNRPHKININISTEDLIKLKTYCIANGTNQQDTAYLVFKNWLNGL